MALLGLRLVGRPHLPQAVRSNTLRAPFRNASTSTARPASGLRTGIYSTLFVVSAGLFAVYYFDSRSAIHRYIFTPLLRNLVDAETSHNIAVKVLRSGLAPKDTQPDDDVLNFEVSGTFIHVY
jgi:dihydroorotate dehydrogenase